MSHFRHFVAIDWSGAAGERLPGIALALCDTQGGAPVLVRPGHRWSRAEVLDWLRHDLPPHSLVGLDLGVSLPFADQGAFFPGWDQSPPNGPALWELVDDICAGDAHLAATSLVDHPVASRYFRRHGGREGALFGGGAGRLRRTEQAQRAQGCKPYSNFNLVGAAQVGKSSLTGMRVLNRLRGHLPVWPFDPLPAAGSLVLEIYTTLAAIEARRSAARSKIRTAEELDAALAELGSPPARLDTAPSDHAADALITAAWLRRSAARQRLWRPAGLADVAQTEGWTFGAF